MQKITPHLWFDTEAVEAAKFYVSAFGGDSGFAGATTIEDTPSGDAVVVSFRLLGLEFMAISAGPEFKGNPSISFIVNFNPSARADARKDLDSLWEKLSDGGKVLMPLQDYPFSERYGWIQDRFGVSWQLIFLACPGAVGRDIVPSLLFTKEMSGKAEQAMKFYQSIFPNSSEGMLARYTNDAPGKEGQVMYGDFRLAGQWFAAMDGGGMHDFSFNEGVSLIVNCEDQKEVDAYWMKLLQNGGKESRCGWLKDQFGVSWQVIPSGMGDFLGGDDEDGRERAFKAMLGMSKIDIAELERAYKGA